MGAPLLANTALWAKWHAGCWISDNRWKPMSVPCEIFQSRNMKNKSNLKKQLGSNAPCILRSPKTNTNKQSKPKWKLKAKSRNKTSSHARSWNKEHMIPAVSLLYIDIDEQSKLVIKSCFSSSLLDHFLQNNKQYWTRLSRMSSASHQCTDKSWYFGITR